VHSKFELRDETLFLTVNLIDRSLAKHTMVRIRKASISGVYCNATCLQESITLNTLQFNMSLPTTYAFIRKILKAVESDKKLELLCLYLIELYLVEYEMIKFPPSLLAVAPVYTTLCSLYGFKQWSNSCEFHTNYLENQLLECSRLMVSFCQKAGTGKLTG
ncbi:G2/mitotic-specific cyclin-2, partial [Bienertia sinuspersici]